MRIFRSRHSLYLGSLCLVTGLMTVPVCALSPSAGTRTDGPAAPECRIELSFDHPGGLTVARAVGCPEDLGQQPFSVVMVDGAEDLDRDGAFDVFEDRDHDGILDEGEDQDGDGRLTPRGGCEGFLREDVDCDGRADWINEDLNNDGVWDPIREDLDGDRHFDAIDEDFNHNGRLDPGEDLNANGRLDDGTIVDPVTQQRTRVYDAYIEDRNCNLQLDDRPFPGPHDEFGLPPPGLSCSIEESPKYPYGRFNPSKGAVTVLKLQWNGSAYGLAADGAGSDRGTP